MSGIYIPGFEVPSGCANCYFNIGYRACAAMKYVHLGDYGWISDERHKDCPLVPVPSHGDLIDRNTLYDKTAKLEEQALVLVAEFGPDDDRDKWRWWSAVLTERTAFKHDVADAHTIIPADKEATDAKTS